MGSAVNGRKKSQQGVKGRSEEESDCRNASRACGTLGQYQEDHTFIVGVPEVEQSGEESREDLKESLATTPQI